MCKSKLRNSDMDSLNLLAAHAAGDFPLQNNWMATNKFDSKIVRAIHATVYTVAYLPTKRDVRFLGLLWISHFIIDSRRWSNVVPIWNDDVSIWYDQALHIIALAIVNTVVK